MLSVGFDKTPKVPIINHRIIYWCLMSIAKDQIKQIVESQPDDSSYDDLLRELAFKRMVIKGLADARAGNVISNEEMGHRIKKWRK